MNLTGAVDHSGDNCSGLCRLPCWHLDCWQCAESEQGIRAMGTQQERAWRVLQEQQHQLDLARFENGTVEITRKVLEELCKRAAVTLTWDDEGNPVIEEGRGQFGASSIAAAANRIGKSAADVMDQHVASILKGQDDGREETARKVLKAQGATDEDIAAASEILDWQPPKDAVEQAEKNVRWTEVLTDDVRDAWDGDVDKLVNQWASGPITRNVTFSGQGQPLTIKTLQAEIAKLDALTDGPPPKAILIHPNDYPAVEDYIAKMDAEMQSVSGLRDVLMGGPPKFVAKIEDV